MLSPRVQYTAVPSPDKYLVTVDQVFPLAFALIRTPPEPFLLHFPLNQLPQGLVPLGLREVLFQLCPNSDELLGFVISPLRNTILLLQISAADRGEGPHIRVVHVMRHLERHGHRQRA